MVPCALGGREGGAREARHDADRRGHRLPVQRLLRLAVARGRRAGVGRQGRVGGPPPQGPVPVLAGLMDGNGCSIGTHILSYKPCYYTWAPGPTLDSVPFIASGRSRSAISSLHRPCNPDRAVHDSVIGQKPEKMDGMKVE